MSSTWLPHTLPHKDSRRVVGGHLRLCGIHVAMMWTQLGRGFYVAHVAKPPCDPPCGAVRGADRGFIHRETQTVVHVDHVHSRVS